MEDDLKVCRGMHRLKSLQNLCRGSEVGHPHALLIIPGIDGRNNKESTTLLKYIFSGAAGWELLDSSVADDALEDIVLLIQMASISVIYTSSARRICGTLLSACPNLTEFVSSSREEDQIDSQQSRKVCDFKRMMLESIPRGSIVGMSIPIGYDSVQDVESWPLLQSFALDEIVCPARFFTARYPVVDLSEYLNIAYRGVDEFSVDNAIALIRKSVLPHINQMIAILHDVTGPHGLNLTAADIIGPLEMLYEFGELHCCEDISDSSPRSTDPSLKPVILFGQHTSTIGRPEQYPRRWLDASPAGCVHAVMEGSEPSTGIRFCRTYFLDLVDDLLLDDVTDEVSRVSLDEELEPRHSRNSASKQTKAMVSEHLQRIYVKLYLSLRHSVEVAFRSFTDVLQAGTYVQNAMDSYMKGRTFEPNLSESYDNDDKAALHDDFNAAHPYLSNVVLKNNEMLQVHMDCMNSLGQIIGIEDVDDIGGTCWTYIRVSVDGIFLGTGKDTGSVSVGDTFLFCVAKKLLINTHQSLSKQKNTFRGTLLSDSCCITHVVPYYRTFTGNRFMDLNSRRRSQNMLGDSVTATSSSFISAQNSTFDKDNKAAAAMSVSLITDHPTVPLLCADIQLHAAGFLLEKCDSVRAPIVVCMEEHVAEMWTLDCSDLIHLAHSRGILQKTNTPIGQKILPELTAPDGFMIIFRLKTSQELRSSEGTVSESDNNSEGSYGEEKSSQQYRDTRERSRPTSAEDASSSDKRVTDSRTYNPLQQSLSPFCLPSSNSSDVIEPTCLGIFAPTGSKLSAALSSCLISWRAALQSLDIPVHRGNSRSTREKDNALGCDGAVPSSMILAFISAIDTNSLADCLSQGTGFGSSGDSEGDGKGFRSVLHDESIPVSANAMLAAAADEHGFPGTGFLSMRCTHSLSESIRLKIPTQGLQTALSQEIKLTDKNMAHKIPQRLLIVVGPSGSGVLTVGTLIGKNLAAHDGFGNVHVSSVQLNIAEIVSDSNESTDHQLIEKIRERCDALFASSPPRLSAPSVIIVSLTTSAECYIDQADLSNLLVMSAQKCSATIAVDIGAVVSVVAPNALLQESLTSLDWNLNSSIRGFFGLESYRGRVKSLCTAGVCDILVIIDANKSTQKSDSLGCTYTEIRQWAESVNSEVEFVKINPSSMRFEEEITDLLVSLADPLRCHLSKREMSSRVRHSTHLNNPADIHISRSHVPDKVSYNTGLCSLHLSPATAQSASSLPQQIWSVQSLLSVLQVLFPSASVCCPSTALSESWCTAPTTVSNTISTITSTSHVTTPVRGFQRLIQLAKAKVFAARRSSTEASALAELLRGCGCDRKIPVTSLARSSGCVESDISMLIMGLISVQGYVYVRAADLIEKSDSRYSAIKSTDGYRMFSVEACAGFIIVKEIICTSARSSGRSSSGNNGYNQQLLAEGSFNLNCKKLLIKLFGACEYLHLFEKHHLTKYDINTGKMESIQSKYCGMSNEIIPLPGGWWFDGNAYLDIHGNKSKLRPDIGHVLDKYLLDENVKISSYNSLLECVRDYSPMI